MVDKQKPNLKYLVIGTGRSGTGYMSKLLSLNNIPCGHEQVCGYPVLSANYINNISETRLKAESSWLSVPFLHEISEEYPDISYIFIVRDPVKVIKSFIEIDFFNENNTGGAFQLVKNVMPRVEKLDPVEASISYYVTWHNMIASFLFYKNPRYITLQLEDINYTKLSLYLRKPFLKKLNERVNLKEKTKKISKSSLMRYIKKHDKFSELRSIASKYGYSL